MSNTTSHPKPHAASSLDGEVGGLSVSAADLLQRARWPEDIPVTEMSKRALRHVVLAEFSYMCALCGSLKSHRLKHRRIVPRSYGGPRTIENFWPLCQRCAKRRHVMKGTSPRPERPEDLFRVFSFDHLRRDVVRILRDAAACVFKAGYDSVSESLDIAERVSRLVGWRLKDRPCPERISPADWAWLCSSAPWDVVYWNAFGLLPADGNGA